MRDHRNRITRLTAIYGADPRRWPVADSLDPEALSEAGPDVLNAIAREGRLDQRLDSYTVPKPSAALIGRILAAARIAGISYQ